jgi:hypothetical protein
MRAAGSNLLFAVVTEVSDSVLKGAETSGFDGLVNGFRRGILNVAMKPAVLRSAVLQGGSTRIIKLDRNVGMDEVRHFWSLVTAEIHCRVYHRFCIHCRNYCRLCIQGRIYNWV